jgi:hypothetical protein
VLSEGKEIVRLLNKLSQDANGNHDGNDANSNDGVRSLFTSLNAENASPAIPKKQTYIDTGARINYNGHIRLGAPYGGCKDSFTNGWERHTGDVRLSWKT